jgi:hypothetical protein
MSGYEPIPLNLKKRVPKKPKIQPPYNKTKEIERRKKHKANEGFHLHRHK